MLFGLRGFRDELERINGYVRNRTHRLHYRETIRRCSERRIGARRKLLNPREARLLHGILDESNPPDPFSDDAPQEITVDAFERLWTSLYDGKTSRTMARELVRLAELGFIRFLPENGGGRWSVTIDFGAIARY